MGSMEVGDEGEFETPLWKSLWGRDWQESSPESPQEANEHCRLLRAAPEEGRGRARVSSSGPGSESREGCEGIFK